MINPPRVGAFVSLPELGEPKPTLREAVQIAKTINRTAGLIVLGQMNLFLGAASIKADLDKDPDAKWKAQEHLLRTTISERRLRILKAKLFEAHLRDRVVYHRSQLLAAIRMVALFGEPVRGNMLESREDFGVLTGLALSINSLQDFGRIPSGHVAARHLAAQLAPSRELENLPRIDNALVRSRRMLGDILKGKQWMPLAKELEQLFVFLTNGFSFDAFRDMLFGVFWYFQVTSTTSLDEFRRHAFFNPHAAGNIVSGPLFEQFLANLSVEFGELPAAVGSIGDERTLMLDLTPFRARPVWRFAPDSYLCVDPCFLTAKLASGFYWAVNQALETIDEDETGRRRLQFSRLWGRCSRSTSSRTCATPFHLSDWWKTFLMTTSARRPSTPSLWKTRTRSCLRSRDCSQERKQSIPAHSFRSSRGFRRSSAISIPVPSSNWRQAYATHLGCQEYALFRRSLFAKSRPDGPGWPVVVVLEPILGLGLASRLLVERFVHRIRGLVPAYTSVRPVVFLDIEDIEIVVQNIREGDFKFVDCLREKLGHDPTHFFSFNDFYWGQFVPEHNIEFRKNTIIADEYRDLGDAALDKCGSGGYKDCVRTPFGAVFKRRP